MPRRFNYAVRRSRHFWKASSGQVAMFLALALVPLVFLLGAAVDYGRANSLKAAAMKAADAASLAALVQDSKQDGKEMAERAFRNNLAALGQDPDGVRLKKLDVKLNPGKSTATVTCELEIKLRLVGLVSNDGWLPVDCSSQATKGAPAQVDLYVLADNSLSMTRPMDPMIDPPMGSDGCRFACHTTAKELKSRNIKSRYAAGAAMVSDLVDKLNSSDARYSLYTASSTLQLLVDGKDAQALKQGLDSVVFASDSRGSHLGALFKPFADQIGRAPAERRRIVIVLGDAQEEWRNADLKWPLSEDPSGDPVWLGAPDGTGKTARAIDFPNGYNPPPTQFLETCAALKAKGFTIYTVYTPTLGTTVNTDPAPLARDATPDWVAPYSHQMNEPASRRAFEACASPGGFVPATNPTEMSRIAETIARNTSQLRITH